jgi:hypothetical protein
MFSKLAVPITLDEVLKTIDLMNGDKSPGPDGLSGNPIPSEMKRYLRMTPE